MPTLDWRPAWDADFGFATAPVLPAITDWLTVSGGKLYAGSEEFICVGAHAHESACAFDGSTERTGMPKRVAAKGVNFVRFLGWNNKVTPSGVWTPGSGGAVAPGDTHDTATYLVRMDETIANLNARGIRVSIGFDHGNRPRIAASLPRNTAYGSSTNEDHGMAWAEEWVTAYENHIDGIMDRTNTITGIAYKDNPGIPWWMAFNESSIADSFTRSQYDDIVNEVGGTGGGSGGGSGYWRAELNSLFLTWATANWPSYPSATFPLYATYTGWGATDKAYMVQFIQYLEARAAARLRAFILARSPNCLFTYTQSSYCDAKVCSDYSDIVGRDSYAFMGTTAAFSAPYDTRSNSLVDANAFYTGAGKFEERQTSNAIVEIETGQYTQNRWDATTCTMAAIMHNLQGGSGYFSLTEGQNASQSAVTGLQMAHILAGWPSRKLGELADGLVMKHRMIGELSTSLTYVVDPAAIPAQVASGGFFCCTGYRFGNTNNGGEWHWLKRKIATDYSTPAMTTPYTGILDANITTGITLTAADGIKGTLFVRGNAGVPLVTYDFPSVVGQTEMVDNRTTGIMQVSGLSVPYAGQCRLIAMGDYPVLSGPALLFVHGASYRTDMTIDGSVGGTTTEERFTLYDGNNVSNDGTENNTRIWVPAAHTIAITSPVNLTVCGVTAAGALVDMGGTYSAGVRTFTTSTSYPLYRVDPVSTTPVRTRRRNKVWRRAPSS